MNKFGQVSGRGHQMSSAGGGTRAWGLCTGGRSLYRVKLGQDWRGPCMVKPRGNGHKGPPLWIDRLTNTHD